MSTGMNRRSAQKNCSSSGQTKLPASKEEHLSGMEVTIIILFCHFISRVLIFSQKNATLRRNINLTPTFLLSLDWRLGIFWGLKYVKW